MRKALKLLLIVGTALIAAGASAQSIRWHLSEVHITASYALTGNDSLLIRGATQSNKKILLRLNNLGAITNGAQIRTECLKFATIAEVNDGFALEVTTNGVTYNYGAAPDERGYTNAIADFSADKGAGCLLASKQKYDYTKVPVGYFTDLP